MLNFVTKAVAKAFNKAASFQPIKAVVDDYLAMVDTDERIAYSAFGVGKIGLAAVTVPTLPLWGKSSEMDCLLMATMCLASASAYTIFALMQADIRADADNGYYQSFMLHKKEVYASKDLHWGSICRSAERNFLHAKRKPINFLKNLTYRVI